MTLRQLSQLVGRPLRDADAHRHVIARASPLEVAARYSVEIQYTRPWWKRALVTLGWGWWPAPVSLRLIDVRLTGQRTLPDGSVYVTFKGRHGETGEIRWR